jgi:hypothetical protein
MRGDILQKKGLIVLFNVLLYVFIILVVIILFKFFFQKLENKERIIINDFHNAVYVQDMVPMTDEEGKKISAYEFFVENTSSKPQKYYLYLNEVVASLDEDDNITEIISEKVLKYQLVKNDQEITIGFLSDLDNNLLDYDTLKGSDKNKYIVRIWIAENTKDQDWSNKTFNYQFSVIGK